MTAKENYQAALRHVSRLKELTQFELEELQDFIHDEMARGRQYAFDNWSNDPDKHTGKGIVEDIDNMLNDPDFIRLLPLTYFEAEKLLKEVQKRLNKTFKVNRSSQTLLFTDLFQQPVHAHKVKELLESAGVTIEGIYKPDPTRCRKSDTELLKAFEVLEPLMSYRFRNRAVKCFYNEFQASVEVTDRTLSEKPDNLNSPTHIMFKEIFSPLLPKK